VPHSKLQKVRFEVRNGEKANYAFKFKREPKNLLIALRSEGKLNASR
jgi:hypothetical protein